jgi:glycosyltransferase involved in cell wall biosynthesis
MKIALISVDFFPNVGGVAAHVVELGKALVAKGHDVHVLTLPIADKQERYEVWHGMKVYRPKIPKTKFFYTPAMKLWLKSFLKQNPMDVLHVHGMRPLEATKGIKNIPIIFTNHTSGFLRRLKKGNKVHAELVQRLDHICHILAPSEELCEATLSVGFKGPVEFIPNGVDIDRFRPRIKSSTEQQVTILLARRLVDKNGGTVFAEAVGQLKSLDVKIVFAGDGPEKIKIIEILEANGMLEKTSFLDNVPNDRMPTIYQAADISVLPSFMEATSITGLESMASGLPLIGTRVGGIPTLINDGETGLLVPPGSPQLLGEAMIYLVNEPVIRHKMAKKAREKAERDFSWLKIADKTIATYKRYCT